MSYQCCVEGCPANHVSKHEICVVSSKNSFFRGAIRGRVGPTEVRIEGPVTTAAGVKGISMPRNTARALGEWLIALSGDLRKPDETSVCRWLRSDRGDGHLSVFVEGNCGVSFRIPTGMESDYKFCPACGKRTAWLGSSPLEPSEPLGHSCRDGWRIGEMKDCALCAPEKASCSHEAIDAYSGRCVACSEKVLPAKCDI